MAEPTADASAASLELFDQHGRRSVELLEAVTRLGRAADNHVQVADARVSKHHAEIVRDGAGYRIRDVGSKAGVLCNGTPVTEHRLRDGDVLLLGRASTVRLVFRSRRDAPRSGDSALRAAFADTSLVGPEAARAARGRGARPGSSGDLTNLARFLELSRTLSGHMSPDEVVDSVLDLAIEMTQAERGFVILCGADDRLQVTAVRWRGGQQPPTDAPPAISETIVRQVLAQKAPRVVSDVALDAGLATAQSVMDLGLGSVAAMPLWRHTMPAADQPAHGRHAQPTDDVFGVLCLDSRDRRQAFDAVDLGILEALARDASAAIENARLMREAHEKQRMEQEFARAREVQAALVPDRYWSAPHFDVAGSYAPCLDLGGDYLGQFRRDGDAHAFVVADVCGKGLNAALLAAALQGALLVEFGTDHALARVVGHANRVIGQVAPVGKFISMLACSLDAAGVLRHVNAGHCPLLVVRRDEVESLVTGGIALGLDAAADYAEHTLQLVAGDVAVLYTDGILEAMNAEREPFGEERIVAALAGCHGLPAQAICARLLAAIATFCGDAPLADDTTVMVVAYRAEASA